MIVEIADHASNRGFQQLTIVDRLNIITFDAGDNFGEEFGLFTLKLRHCRGRRLFRHEAATQ